MRKILKLSLVALPLLGVLGYVAIAGPHHAMTPQLFGAHKLAPNLFTDAPQREKEFLLRIKAARSETRAFFGPLQTEPTYIFCTTERCQKTFGIGARGLNLGKHYVLIAPSGISQMIVTHETVHNELHRGQTLKALWDPDFPQWFDEGLASLLSRDTRLTHDVAPEWIYAAHTPSDWSSMTTAENWRANYGAAWSVVSRFEKQHGRDGLRKLVARVESGEDFLTLWQESYSPAD